MGFFSWKTRNTDRSIPSIYSEREPINVVMIAPDGTLYEERAYEGYGEFGGKDYYELMAEINGLPSDRSKGIDISFNPEKHGKTKGDLIYPQLVEGTKDSYLGELNPAFFTAEPEDCEYQGFFYPEEDEDEEDDWIMSEDDEDDEW